MPSYVYTALDARGMEVSDTLEAGTEQEAVATLRQAGFYPTSVMEAGKAAKAARGGATKAPKVKAAGLKKEINLNIPFLERKTIKPKTLMIFTRQLATLIDRNRIRCYARRSASWPIRCRAAARFPTA